MAQTVHEDMGLPCAIVIIAPEPDGGVRPFTALFGSLTDAAIAARAILRCATADERPEHCPACEDAYDRMALALAAIDQDVGTLN
jgi:hypothetical protein